MSRFMVASLRHNDFVQCQSYPKQLMQDEMGGLHAYQNALLVPSGISPRSTGNSTCDGTESALVPYRSRYQSQSAVDTPDQMSRSQLLHVRTHG